MLIVISLSCQGKIDGIWADMKPKLVFERYDQCVSALVEDLIRPRSGMTEAAT